MSYKCKECGGEMTHEYICTYPGINCYRCKKCGRHVDEGGELGEDIEILK